MQSPTPPTKPTPPTPPSMKTSTAVPSTDIHAPGTTAPQSTNPSKVVSTAKEQPTSLPASVPQSTNNLPPLVSSSTPLPPTTQLSQNSPSSTGFNVFFVLILIIALALIAVQWWKNYKPKKNLQQAESLPKTKGNFEIRV